MKIGSTTIDCDSPPFVIAEIGVNHDGNVDRALELVDVAQQCGADAVKIQFFTADLLLSKAARLATYQHQSGESDPVEMLKRLELSIDDLATVVERAHTKKLAALVTVFSVELVELAAARAWDAWKVASPDIINRPLINALCADGRPVLLSTGAATKEEVQQAVQWVGDHQHIVMQCVSAYPTPDDHAALAGRIDLERITPWAIGYSDHTTNILTGAYAVASGACVLEKHLTHNRNATGPDHAASLDPTQFAHYVQHAHEAFAMLGSRKKQVLDIELDVRAHSRQSIVARDVLVEGKTIARSDLTIKRPGTGIAPSLIDDLVGRTLTKTVQLDMPLSPDAVQ